MEKKAIINKIISICKNMGVDTNINVKTNKWKADIVVTYSNYKVAFNICKSPNHVADTYKIMRTGRVCGCWLLMPSKFYPRYESSLPCFDLAELNGDELVCLNGKFYGELYNDGLSNMSLNDFIPSLIQGKIQYLKEIRVKYVEIRFFKYECWKCHKQSDVYFVHETVSENGIETGTTIDPFTPQLAKGVKEYIKNHPEEKLIMGDIKPRFSKTRKQEYPSFGCPYCDSLFGQHYINDDINELCYDVKSLQKARIEIPDGIIASTNLWYKQ